MFHIVLNGWIESNDINFISDLEKYINDKNKLVGKLNFYKVEDLSDDKD